MVYTLHQLQEMFKGTTVSGQIAENYDALKNQSNEQLSALVKLAAEPAPTLGLGGGGGAPSAAPTYRGPLNVGTSIVDYLKSIGQPSDFASRAKLAAANGINGYLGTAGQNITLMGKLKASASQATPAQPTPAPTSTPSDTATPATPDVPTTPAPVTPAAPGAPIPGDPNNTYGDTAQNPSLQRRIDMAQENMNRIDKELATYKQTKLAEIQRVGGIVSESQLDQQVAEEKQSLLIERNSSANELRQLQAEQKQATTDAQFAQRQATTQINTLLTKAGMGEIDLNQLDKNQLRQLEKASGFPTGILDSVTTKNKYQSVRLVTDNGGNITAVGITPKGDIEVKPIAGVKGKASKAKGSSGSGGGSGSGSGKGGSGAFNLKAETANFTKAFNAYVAQNKKFVGSDEKYIYPVQWQDLLSQWEAKNGNVKDFISKFKAYQDPNNPSY